VLVLDVVAQDDERLNEFVQALLGTGSFFDVLPVEKARDDDGSVSAIVEMFYLPPAATSGNGQAGAGLAGGGGLP